MCMEKLINVTYGTAGLTAFFASLSLYEWGFVIGMAFSMVLGLATYWSEIGKWPKKPLRLVCPDR